MLSRCALFALLIPVLTACGPRPDWHSGFENGFPGNEWLDWKDSAPSPDGNNLPGRSSAWSFADRNSGEPVWSGKKSYKGWVAGPGTTEHRAYPVLHTDLLTPLVNTFMVYLDVDYPALTPDEWIHLGTWGNFDPDAKSGRWALHTLSVRDRKLEFAHTTPFSGEAVGPAPGTEFPLRRWVRITVYIHYAGNTGRVQAWQDGMPVLRATVSGLREHPGTRLRTAHWGMYASGSIRKAVQYNDAISICRLKKPLDDFVTEPRCR